jgi:hypothetical protein
MPAMSLSYCCSRNLWFAARQAGAARIASKHREYGALDWNPMRGAYLRRVESLREFGNSDDECGLLEEDVGRRQVGVLLDLWRLAST